ncbi:MAG: SDR family oxidoreductase [Acidobacteria bacterium]|nr:SDR family oxidoreductase [Acidobacteriota bacterium]
MELSGRVALVTGGKRIGAVVAVEIAKQGVDIGLCYNRSRAETEKTAASIEALGRKVFVKQADLTRAADGEAFVNESAEALGRIDVLVNMASLYLSTPFDELTVDAFDQNLAVDLRSAWICSRAAVPHMRKAGGGRIINFSDWLSKSGRPRYPGYLPYYVAKTAVIGLTEALALELAADRILVNAIAPGPILAPPDTTDEELAAVEKSTPLGQWGGEHAIADAVLALLKLDFMTGETIRVDGGRHVR